MLRCINTQNFKARYSTNVSKSQPQFPREIFLIQDHLFHVKKLQIRLENAQMQLALSKFVSVLGFVSVGAFFRLVSSVWTNPTVRPDNDHLFLFLKENMQFPVQHIVTWYWRKSNMSLKVLGAKIGPRDLEVIYPKLRTPLLSPTVHVHLFTFLWLEVTWHMSHDLNMGVRGSSTNHHQVSGHFKKILCGPTLITHRELLKIFFHLWHRKTSSRHPN